MPPTIPRTASIDLLRGFIILLMALDHASAMIGRQHFSEFWGVPFKGYPDLGWWLTRFVSHLCAPGFFFLMGMSIFLFAQKRLQSGWTIGRIHRYFLKRGGIILLLMFFLEFPAWGLSIAFKAQDPATVAAAASVPGLAGRYLLIPTSVLYGLGACMMLAGFLWRLKAWQLLSITAASFALSQWYISHSNPNLAFNVLEHLWLVPGKSPGILVIYPIIPWLGIATFGLFWAQLLQQKPQKIYVVSALTGLVFLVTFVVLRSVEWGNFSIADNDNWISFFTLVKYPPSVAFALVTCGLNLLLFFGFSLLIGKTWLHPVRVFGQTAMFFYIAHLYLYAFVGAAFPSGCAIEVLYLCWLLGLVPLYFICVRFLAFKKAKPSSSWWRMI
jgi:uncharacterized membrane protein